MNLTITLPVAPTMFALLVLISFIGVVHDDHPWLFCALACVMAVVAYFFVYGVGVALGA